MNKIVVIIMIISASFFQCQFPGKKVFLTDLKKQNEVQRDSIFEIKSIHLDDNEFDDLEELGKRIGDKSIVLLGEQSHGDGTSFQLKSRIVKYLHEHKNFDAVIFEADFYSVNKIIDRYDPKFDIQDQLKNNIYSFWSETTIMKPFWKYIQHSYKSQNPLIISGIDTRHIGKYASQNLTTELDSLLVEIYPEIIKHEHFSKFIAKLKCLIDLEDSSNFDKNNYPKDEFIEMLNMINEKIKEIDESGFWKQEIENLIAYTNDIWNSSFFSHRNQQMGKNLIWLLEGKFKNKKVIVWSHNQHIMKNRSIEIDLLSKFEPEAKKLKENPLYTEMGEIINKRFKEDVYSIGFLCYQGKYSKFEDAVINPREFDINKLKQTKSIIPPSKTSLESKLENKKGNIFFIDLNQKKETLFSTRALKNHHPQGEFKTEWRKSYDGFIYLKEMKPLFE